MWFCGILHKMRPGIWNILHIHVHRLHQFQDSAPRGLCGSKEQQCLLLYSWCHCSFQIHTTQLLHEYPPFWILLNLMKCLRHIDIMSAKVNTAAPWSTILSLFTHFNKLEKCLAWNYFVSTMSHITVIYDQLSINFQYFNEISTFYTNEGCWFMHW